MNWPDLTDSWLRELASDPAYESVIAPLLIEVLRPDPTALYLDLGAGDGRMMRAVGAAVHGVDINPALLARAPHPVVVGDLGDLRFIRDDSYDGGYVVLALEHIGDHDRFFAECRRIVRPDGVLALVANHPIWTAPGSTPISDSDGEVLWRSGSYFTDSTTEERLGDEAVVFNHRPLGDLMTAAAGHGWSLEEMIERPHHELIDQAGIPRLLACRWRLLR